MRLRLRNPATGALEEPRGLRLPAPADDGGLACFRARVLAECAAAALAYLGDRLDEGPDAPALALGPTRGPAVDAALAGGFNALDLRLLCLKTPYHSALDFSAAALAGAAGERHALLDAARAAGSVAPNPTGLAGYKKRFRDALARDLDFPEALATLWDALRPGALSPGSRLAALRDADEVFGLLRLG